MLFRFELSCSAHSRRIFRFFPYAGQETSASFYIRIYINLVLVLVTGDVSNPPENASLVYTYFSPNPIRLCLVPTLSTFEHLIVERGLRMLESETLRATLGLNKSVIKRIMEDIHYKEFYYF
jgi:hypothetical protein